MAPAGIAHRLDFVITDENDLIAKHGAGLRIYQAASFDRCDLSRCARSTPQPYPQHECESSFHLRHLNYVFISRQNFWIWYCRSLI